MSYDKFERSSEKSVFQDYTLVDGTIAWIDILGVRELPHSQLSKTMRIVLDTAAEATSTGPIFETNKEGLLIGTPNKAAQYAIIGDTIVLVEQNQPKTRAAAKLALFYRAGLLSKMLFEKGLLHRGVIVEGEVDCFQKDHTPVITGAGVIQAYLLEKEIKATGLYVHGSCSNFFRERSQQLNSQNSFVTFKELENKEVKLFAPNVERVMYNLTTGYDAWSSALKSAEEHEKVSNSFMILEQIMKCKGGKP